VAATSVRGGRAPFPSDKLRPTPGTFEGEVMSNSAVGRPPALVHRITIPLEPFDLDGRRWETQLVFPEVRLDVRSWRSLPGRDYSFPRQPVYGFRDGERVPVGPALDGSLELLGVPVPVRGLRLAFGDSNGARIAATLAAAIEFAATETPYESCELELALELGLGEITVIGDIAATTPPGPEEARARAADAVDISDYEPELRDGRLRLRPRTENPSE
jgi:hypothetical protein